MIRITTTLLALCAVSSSVAASPQAGSDWGATVARGMADADPTGDWQLAPADHGSGVPGEAEITLTFFRDGSTEARYGGDVTLKRGIIAGMSRDGSEALLLATDVLVCDWEFGCAPFEGIEPDEIDFNSKAKDCSDSVCGADIDDLIAASPAYLVADVVHNRDGSTAYRVTGLVVGFQTALHGIEPDEID
jgi:hypothetical protein